MVLQINARPQDDSLQSVCFLTNFYQRYSQMQTALCERFYTTEALSAKYATPTQAVNETAAEQAVKSPATLERKLIQGQR